MIHNFRTDDHGNHVVELIRNGGVWDRATVLQISPNHFDISYSDGTWGTARSLKSALNKAIAKMEEPLTR